MDRHQIIQIATSILKDGHTTEIPAFGISMFPTLLPGDRLVIEPTEVPKIGDIVVFKGKDSLIAHRLVKVIDDQYICLGDSLFSCDPPIKKTDILGRVIQRTRNGKSQSEKHFRFKLTKRIMPHLGKYPRLLIRYSALSYAKLKKL